MSQQTGDKEEIAAEERAQMLRKIPVGGIKMPGFCRSNSKEPCKDEEKAAETETDTETPAGKEKENELSKTEKETKETKETKDDKKESSKEKEGRKGILDAIRLPLGSVFPRKKNKEGELELGNTGTAGLASVETLDDGVEKRPEEMETVRLDGDAGDIPEPPKQHLLVACISMARRNLFALVATLCILLSVIIIICVACLGPRRAVQYPLRDTRYVKGVTSCGPIEGLLEDGAYAFRGIPFAVPPLENRRWQPAEGLRRIEHCWNGTYQAHNTSEYCWQRRDGSGATEGSEDCLYLDVFTPNVRYDSPLPVVVMIGAETLSGPSPGVMQPSAKLARVRDMVFVRPNFRLGVFGFLAAEPLSRSTHPPTSGNYGLSDVLLALQWVQLNIEHFGGNKSSVTLWGHRAGGTLVTALLGAKRARGLFARVWISSGSGVLPARELSVAEKGAEQFLNSVRCSDAACLRSKSAEELMDSVPETWNVPGTLDLPEPREATNRERRHEWIVLDGAILQESVGQTWAREDMIVKAVMGSTKHAGASKRYLEGGDVMNATQVERIVRESVLGTMGLADEALKRYNASVDGLLSMISDIRVICPLLTVSRMKTNIPFYAVSQPRGKFADVDSDAAAILGSYAARTPEEKRHLSAIQQLFNRYVWQGEVLDAAKEPSSHRVLIVGQDVLSSRDYPNCDYWIERDVVPLYGRVD